MFVQATCRWLLQFQPSSTAPQPLVLEVQHFRPPTSVFGLLPSLGCSPGILQVQIQCPLRGNQENVVSSQVHHCPLHHFLIWLVTPQLGVDIVREVGSSFPPVRSESFDQIIDVAPEKTRFPPIMDQQLEAGHGN